MRRVLLLLVAGCSSHAQPAAAPDADVADVAEPDAPAAMADASGVPLAGFGDLSGACGVLTVANLTDGTPALFRDTLTFMRRYNDPADRPLLTAGGQRLAATPNAGGSSGLSEIFAYEELARCELADLLKTETEIVYDTTGKITDMEVMVDGHKIGVSVTRAQTYPLGQPYPLDTATTLISRKLTDIQTSTADVSAQDRWDKQILAVLAWDTQAADMVEQAWNGLDASVKANTLVIVTSTDGDDTFIYTNM
jgi:hypothetical protein